MLYTVMHQTLGTRWPFTGVSRALRAQNPEKVCRKSPGASGPGAPESLEKVSKKSFRDLFETFSRLSRLFPDFSQTLGGPRGRRLRETFSRLFRGHSGPEGPSDPCKWPTGSQTKQHPQCTREFKMPRARNISKGFSEQVQGITVRNEMITILNSRQIKKMAEASFSAYVFGFLQGKNSIF